MADAILSSNATEGVLTVNGVVALKANQSGVLSAGAAGVSGLDVATVGQLGLSKYYESAEQTITSAGLLTLSHSLGVMPKLYTTTLVCKTVEAGFSVGDETSEIILGFNGASRGLVVAATSSTFAVRFATDATAMWVLHKTTGAVTALTNANWRLIVRAWA